MATLTESARDEGTWLVLTCRARNDSSQISPSGQVMTRKRLCDVFIQKAVAAWDYAPNNPIMVSLLLPGPMEMDQWLKDVRASKNMWPVQKTAHGVTNQMATRSLFMRRERRRLQAIFGRKLNRTGL